ncbi:hypothetical protein [Roseimicrobium sp. ORNL1]|uniref:hypothetical protein n=1 Tax=Roseimicrobium sp. ORNL1 TaxID=2711231 RepID=UPI0013E178C4|nr:hypothetical protein [Roseimicrobium sp. ORNL1]QIF05815.1 hypothetical protein G5S37_31420 [Roseimicrobium sp. ORNL1]
MTSLGKTLRDVCMPLAVAMGAFGFTIGIFVGLCSSPIATTFIPLAFSFLATGGLLLSFFRKSDDEIIPADERRKRATFIAVQSCTFAIGLLSGFYAGVFAKFKPEKVWLLGPPANVYSRLSYSTIDELLAFRTLEGVLAADGIEAEDRLRLMQEMQKQFQPVTQSQSKSGVSSRGYEFTQPTQFPKTITPNIPGLHKDVLTSIPNPYNSTDEEVSILMAPRQIIIKEVQAKKDAPATEPAEKKEESKEPQDNKKEHPQE